MERGNILTAQDVEKIERKGMDAGSNLIQVLRDTFSLSDVQLPEHVWIHIRSWHCASRLSCVEATPSTRTFLPFFSLWNVPCLLSVDKH